MTSLLVTPENWCDLVRLAEIADAGISLRFTLVDADGHHPLGRVALDELRAVHHTFGAWWPRLGAADAPASLAPGAYDQFLADSRALLRQCAEHVLDVPTPQGAITHATLSFPGPGHPWLHDAVGATAFLKQFLWLPHSPSLAAWAHGFAAAPDGPEAARRQVWLRLVLQKVAVETTAAPVLDCLRATYAGDEPHREALRADDIRLLEQSGLQDLAWIARALGLDRPSRTAPALPTAPRRQAAPVPAPADVTVLVPSYAHADYITATLESVLAQSHTAFRLVVVDDGSPDDTVARASRLDDPRLRVQVNPIRLGLGDSVRRALEAVDTPYVALLNSDDLFHPERLARCLDALARAPHAQVVATGVATIDADGHALTADNVRRIFDGHRIADWLRWHADRCRVEPAANVLPELLERNFLVTSSNIVARTAFLRTTAEALAGLKYCLDWQVFLDAAAEGALLVLPDALLAYRLHGANTVWFDEVRSTVYAVEVNRVLARALRRQAPPAAGSDGTTAALLDLLANHAARHSNASGLLLYATELVGDRELEAARERDPAVHGHLRTLAQGQGTSVLPVVDGARDQRVTAAMALAEVAREEATRAADTAIEARVAAESEARAAAEANALVQAHAAALAEAGAALSRAEAATRDALAAREADQVRLSAEVERAAARLQSAEGALAALRVSPEYLVGDRLWNRARGARIGRPAVKALRTLRDRRNRAALSLGRAAHAIGLARPRAVVAACWSFPIHSQTFVYQEMTALAWAGFDTRVFCCDTNPKSELPAAFADLWPKRLVMQTDWSAGQRDLAHFRRTRPQRVDGLLALLADATGKTREALLDESIVLTGFTFARHLELAQTSYLHTYFFYDQSFLALMAAYLLQVPRGITCYADHMLGDYAFKLVPLHLRLADIVVATSARIKDELIELGGEPGKIIVKPNGIDVSRFPHVPAADRLARGGVPELVGVQRIEPKKGLIHLVDAMALLRDRGIAARLNIVGGADRNTPTSAACHEALVARIDALRLHESVILHGTKQQHEFAPIVARSRLFVAPYVETDSGDKDGIPTAVLEAMSTGLPIVATDAGSIGEASRDGIEAFIVPQRDPEALADAIGRLLTDAALYTRMSDAARARAVDAFDIHVTETLLHERIRAVLARA